MKTTTFYFSFLVCCFIFSCKKRRDEPQPTTGTVEGTIFSTTHNYEEIQGAKIYVAENKTAISGTDGTFQIENVSKGTYHIIVEHSQYYSDTIVAEVMSGERINVSFDLVPIGPLLAIENDIDTLYFNTTTHSLGFTIENRGTGMINWELSFESENWFSIDHVEGVEKEEVLVEINRNALPAGENTYYADILVKNKDNSNDFKKVVLHIDSENKLISFKPGADKGKDATVKLYDYYYDKAEDHPYGETIAIDEWTKSSVYSPTIGVIEFIDLDTLTNIQVLSAELIFHDGSYISNDIATTPWDADNTVDIYLITEDWQEDGLTGANVPSYSTNISAEIPRNNDASALKVADVTLLVQEALDNPNSYHGFYMTHRIQSPYRAMTLVSSDGANADEHPELKLTYIQK